MRTRLRLQRLFLAAAAVLLVGGCAARFGHAPLAEWADDDPATWTLGHDAANHRTDALPTTGPAADEVPADAAAGDYVALALTRNPELIAATYRVDRVAARVPQATSLDDPMLSVTPIGEMAETAAGRVGLMSGVSQKLPLPQKLNARGNIVRGDVAVARSELEQARLRVVADTRQAYWSLYYAVRSLEETRQSRELLSSFRQITSAKFAAGTATQADVLRATTELSNVDNQLLTLAQQRDTAAARLNSLIDRPVTATLPEPAAVEPRDASLQLDALLAAAGAGNPQLRGVLAEIEQGRSRLRLARLNYVPDLTVSANYNFVNDGGLALAANGDDQYWVGFAINLPVWYGRLRAAEREAFRGIQENVSRLTAAQNRLAFQVREAYAAVDTQQRMVALFRDAILPQAKQTVDASAAGYQAGNVDFLAYVEAWRRLLDYRLMYQRSVSQLEQQLAELERLVGRPLETDLQRAEAQP